MIDINNYRKDRTVCKTFYNKNRRKNNINTLPPKKINTSYQQPNIENVNNTKKQKNIINKDNNPKVSTYEKPSSCHYWPKQRIQNVLHAQST